MVVQCVWPALSVRDTFPRAQFLSVMAHHGVKKSAAPRPVALTRNASYFGLGASCFNRLDSTKATANLIRRLHPLGYDANIRSVA